MKAKKTIVTHSGDFHPDDVFAVATIALALNSTKTPFTIIRSRDAEIIKKGDYVVDVGGEYNELANRFDHHQAGGGGARANNVPYASFGLVWKKFGEKICGSKYLADLIDERLVQPIDAPDNGVEIYTPTFPHVHPYQIQNIIFSFLPTWKEDTKTDGIFNHLIQFVQPIIEREVKALSDIEEGKRFVEDAYRLAEDKRIIILEKGYPWQVVLNQYREPLFAVYPSEHDGTWHAKAVKDDFYQFKNRKDFPETWAGKRDGELAAITGVPEAIFCHNKRFIIAAKTKEAALKLVEMAVNA